jgi:Rrf2 family protein
MKITALEEYGMRCMLVLARSWPDGKPSLTEIAEQEALTVSYTGKLLAILRDSGLVEAERGRKGGYSLTRPPEEINLAEIFDALGEPIFSAAHCERYTGEEEQCVHLENCKVRSVWQTIGRYVGAYLKNISLAELAHNEAKDLRLTPEEVTALEN